MKMFWITTVVIAVILLTTPVIAAPATQVSTPDLLTEMLTRLEKIEAQIEVQAQHIALLDDIARQVCEAAEMKNPEREKYYDGMRLYSNYDTAVVCLSYRNAHLYYDIPSSHRDTQGNNNVTPVESNSTDELHLQD